MYAYIRNVYVCMHHSSLHYQTGYKEREDRIAELEEFINDQVTELDKMEAALKQTVANKETLEKEFNELNVCTVCGLCALCFFVKYIHI